MKIRKSLIVSACTALLIALSACSVTAPVAVSPSPSPSTPPVIAKSIKVYDANDVFLGYCVDINSMELTIYSSGAFLYTLSWNGQIPDRTCYYTGNNGMGFAFIIVNAPGDLYAKTVYRVGTSYYSFATTNIDGTAASDGSITAYRSAYSGLTGLITDYSSDQSLQSIDIAYPVLAQDRAAFGIPASVATPLKLSFDD
jgi:hypothetical protein